MSDPKKPQPPLTLPRRPPPVPPAAARGGSGAREALERAKAAAVGERPKTEVMGRFDEPVPEDAVVRPPTAPSQISEESARGLEAMAAEARRAAAQAPVEEVPPEPDMSSREETLRVITAALDTAEVFDDRPRIIRDTFAALKIPPPPSPAEVERQRVEASLRKLDIGQYIMTGYLEQEVPIVEAAGVRLVATFRSVQDMDDAFLERELRKFRSASPPPTALEFMRHQTRLALALQIRAYGGNKWPSIRTAAGAIDEAGFEQCLEKVQKIPSQIIQRLAQHAAWFNERIEALLSDREVLTFG